MWPSPDLALARVFYQFMQTKLFGEKVRINGNERMQRIKLKYDLKKKEGSWGVPFFFGENFECTI